MKKLISVFALCALFCCGLFAQEDSKSSNYGLERPLRFEVGYAPLLGVDFRGAYMFPINDVLRWDVGLEVNSIDLVLSGRSQNVLAVGSFCFWDFYTSYGLGIGFNDAGGAAFIPLDLRIGWEPGFRKDKKWGFKLETGLFGNTYKARISNNEFKTKYTPEPKIGVGAVFRP